jgi:predicted aminopeptidase
MALLLRGWFSAGYVVQAAVGQLQILHAARPLSEAMSDPKLPARTKRLLASVDDIKAFGQSEGLRPTDSYERYAELHRPAAAWVVQAAAPLSFEVRRWNFPVVGSVPYLGFFDEDAARRFAARLEGEEGLDVDVRTASAFSTLGWFHDPVLSTMLGDGPEALGALANVVLHESVHATVYVNDQSAFNESVATFVADRLTEEWLNRAVGPDAPETRAWLAAHARERARIARLHSTYEELAALYASGASDDAKRAGKERLLARAGEDLALARPLNNAALSGFRTYDTGAAALEQLLARCEGNWPRFLEAVRGLTPADFGSAQRDGFDAVIGRLGSMPVAAASVPRVR